MLTISGFSQSTESTFLSADLQKEKLIELESIIDNMSFASKERYLDSLQIAGVIIRKNITNDSKGCTLEDREEMFVRPQEEVVIFLEKNPN